MLHLLAPAALLGLLALGVPAVLHLRRPPPPTVRVGSLRHLDARPRRRFQWWRWRDRVLLALRLTLLALLTLALTRPAWRRPRDRTPRRWALVDPAAAWSGPARERLAARRAAGDSVRLLADGFPELRPGEVPRPDAGSPAAVDVWSLLREADAGLPAGSSLIVFSPARLASLRGERPTLGRVAVDWVETPPAAVPPAAPPAAAEPRPAWRVFVLHTPERAEDAQRLAAAVRSAASPEAVIVLINPARPATASLPPDWVFCLGGPRPEALAEAAGVADARNLFTDAGDVRPADGDSPPPGVLVAPELAGGPDVLVRRRVPLAPDGAAHWRDDTGKAVLTVTREDPGGRRRWRFGSRFDPAWNDLPATTGLAEVLHAWFLPETDEPTAADPRLAGAEQARPRAGAVVAGERAAAWPWPADLPGGGDVDLRPWALALAAGGFLLERLWAWRRAADRRRPLIDEPR